MAYAFSKSSFTKEIAHNIILEGIKVFFMFPVVQYQTDYSNS